MSIKKFSIIMALLLTGCSSPTPLPIPQPSPPQPTTTVLLTQPATVPAFSNANPPINTTGVTLWGPVEKLPSLPTNATSSNGALSIVIDNASIPGNVAARNGLGTIVLGHSFKPFVSGNAFSSSYQLRVANARSISQVVAYFNLHDRVNNTSLWLGQIAFDTRCNKGIDALWDSGTNTPIYNVLAGNFSCSTFDWRTFSFSISSSNVAAASAALANRVRLSPNIGDYDLTHVNINPEAVGATSRIDLDIQQWRVAKSP